MQDPRIFSGGRRSSRRGHNGKRRRNFVHWSRSLKFADKVALISMLAGVLALAPAWISLRNDPSFRVRRGGVEARIIQLSKDLQAVSRSIDGIEGEIRARQDLVTKLQQDQQRFEQLQKLSKPQIDAITSQLQGELDRAERRSLRQDILLMVIGAFLGVGVQGGLSMLYRRVRGRRGIEKPMRQ